MPRKRKKNQEAARLVSLRWKRTTKAERQEQMRLVRSARTCEKAGGPDAKAATA